MLPATSITDKTFSPAPAALLQGHNFSGATGQ
jgi:hypothetical protein